MSELVRRLAEREVPVMVVGGMPREPTRLRERRRIRDRRADRLRLLDGREDGWSEAELRTAWGDR